MEKTHHPILLKNYTPSAFKIHTVALTIRLHEDETRVMAHMTLARDEDPGQSAPPLVLLGRELDLASIALDGEPLPPSRYVQDEESLTIAEAPDSFTLGIETKLRPQDNTALEGLYKSSGMFCTQCEAEGFRRITYFLDRPDVMARYITTIEADKTRYPILLANGNPIKRGELAGNRHFVTWHDPFPKPCYLFAMVAGDLASVEDSFVTMSGRRVALQIFVQRHNLDKCEHAMRSLKKAMQWDEEKYGREYDLDIYMIVAVDDFNMGAMENKGLNIFNSARILAKPETATDGDYQGIEAVVAHEYFHNWTGNRVTCRDWFQLSLKEGLTVFRDEQFSADMISGPVERIHNVQTLRAFQFPEDAGPMAHPVRPESYIEINNFYTTTVYNKGSEVVRMIHTLLGPAGFRKGMDLYFLRHDGQAVTIEDFVVAMETATGKDLSLFSRWYSQAGTPELHVTSSYAPETKTYTLTVRQSCPPTPGQPRKEPFHIPLAVGLLDRDGLDLPLQLAGEEAPDHNRTRVLELREETTAFVFVNIPAPPVPSLLRGFSAPVKLVMDYSDAELTFLCAHDSDPFNRWDAGQQLAIRVIMRLVTAHQAGEELVLDQGLVAAFAKTLAQRDMPPALVAAALTLPPEVYLAELMEQVDVVAIHTAREFVRRSLAQHLAGAMRATYHALDDCGPYNPEPEAVGKRSLKNLCLAYLMTLDAPEICTLCMTQFAEANNMTDSLSALAALANRQGPERETALAQFYAKWRDEPLVVDKWFAIQATSKLPDTLARVQGLLAHPAFNIKNPNKVRALINSFCLHNQLHFHDESGAGYAFLADQILKLDPMNPQIAARLLKAMSRWRKFDPKRQEMMRAQLERVVGTGGLSKAVYEIASKSLAG